MAEYIERKAAYKRIISNKKWSGSPSDMEYAAELVLTVPTADVVEVRHGEWNDNIIGFCNVCMECGAIVERTAIKNKSGDLNYCPNCGAKMDGKDGAE